MGDFFERIVDVDVTEEQAGALAARTISWLVAEGVITPELSSEGVYSPGADMGHPPGRNWRRAVADTPGAPWTPGPVAVMTGRNSYTAGQGGDEADRATCPRCARTVVVIDPPGRPEPDEAAWRPFREAVAVWRRTGAASVACPSCGTAVPVTEWDFGPGFALGALAFDFWGWPPLAEGFHAEFRRYLGHRTHVHTGKF
ncbi:hypothetical protein [Streptomyces tropicalis]|uniref:Uncharacterized protein n=1 Tax=Streptomyces tropicalis TaxID=3034234 RepID=A0ABT6A0Z3_9ACTN|nr:hypothetical protein [Streptomyces tropicalis]MDF3298132.1 hypothetical protein [Streptomyces tropicalis]